MNASAPERPSRRDSVRRAGIAGITAALLAGSALGAAPGMQPDVAWAEEPPVAEQSAGVTTTVPASANAGPVESGDADVSGDAPAGDPSAGETSSTPDVATDGEDASAPADASASAGVLPTSQTAPISVNGATVLSAPSSVDQSGLVRLNLRGSFGGSQVQSLVERINAIRAEAASEGITVDGAPVSGTPLRLSLDLSEAAGVRAVEASFSFSHQRPDGSGTVVDSGGDGLTNDPISAENLAAGADAASCLESWYAEKQAYLTYLQTGVDTGNFGHYKSLISDAYVAVGLNSFAMVPSDDGSYATGGTVLAAEFWAADYADTVTASGSGMLSAGDAVMQISVKAADYLTSTLTGPAELQVGQTAQLEFGTTSGNNALGGVNLLTGAMDALFNNMTITSDNPDVLVATNKGLLTARGAGTATVSYREGDTVLASLVVTVLPLTITGVTSPEAITTDAGTAPTLPATLTATMSDGSTAEVPVTWDAVDPSLYGGRAGGEFDVCGTVEGWGAVCAHVVVNPATPTGATIPVTGVDVEANGMPALPQTASVTWSNGEASEEWIAWDAFDPAAYPEGGTVQLTGYVGETGLTVTCTVNVAAPAPVLVVVPEVMGWSEAAASEALANVGLVANVEAGEPAPSPDLSGVVYSAQPVAGTQAEPGTLVTLVVYGEYVPPVTTIAVPEVAGMGAQAASEVLANAGLAASVVTGDPAPTPEQEGAVYAADPAAGTQVEPGAMIKLTAYGEYVTPKPVSVISPADITINAGETPKLPATVDVTMSDGTSTTASVSWENIDPTRYETPGTLTLKGTVSDTNLTVNIKVIVNALTATEVAEVASVTTQAGVAPKLPATTKVTWSNGDVTDEEITWDEIPADVYATPGPFVANGVVDAAGARVMCAVVVEQAPIRGQAGDIEVSTPSGTAPALPASVTMTYASGETFEARASWETPDEALYSAREGGSFEVKGTVEGWDGTVIATVSVAPAEAAEVAEVASVTTQAGVAPKLPATTKVTWSNGDVTDEAITWDAVEEDAYLNGGTFTVEGVVKAVGNAGVSCAVSVEDAYITAVEAASFMHTPSGTPPTLPDRLRVQLSNGTSEDVAVTWDEMPAEQYGARNGGTFSVVGRIEGWDGPVSIGVIVSPAKISGAVAPDISTQEKVAPTLPSTAEVSWTNGDVTDEAVTWGDVDEQAYDKPGEFTVTGTVGADTPVSCKVTVTAATIVEPAEEVSLSTPSGTAPELPKTVKMTFSNAEVREVAVTWNEVSKTSYAVREGGTFQVEGAVEGWDGTVTAAVSVTPATMTSVEAPAGVTTPAGAAPALPKSAKVTWSNDDVTDEAVTWDDLEPASYLEGGTFEVKGSVGAQGSGALDVTCTVTVEPAFIESVAAPEAITTPSGTAPKLPETLTAQMSNGTSKEVAVTWETVKDASWQAHNGGTFEVRGIVEGWDEPVVARITVSPATITKLAELPGISIKEGATPELPTTVSASWSNGDVTDEAVSWEDPGSEAYAKPGSVTLSGLVEGWEQPVTLEVSVEALVPVSVEAPTPVSTEAGTAPVLPTTAKVTWDNGATTDEVITWDAVDEASYHNGGTFSVNGSVANTGLQVSVEVSVADATADSAETPAIETPAGIAPTLPGTVKVTWSNGDITDETVSWAAVDENSYLAPGSFTLEGTFANARVAFKASTNVKVGSAVITGVDIVPAVSTVAGVAPELPQTVTVLKSDGSKAAAPVSWDAIAPEQYGARGLFTVEGSVEGFDGTAQITVKVASATVSSVQQQLSVTTVAGIKPELPATVQFTWSDGSKTAETVNWDRIEEGLYQKEGSFQVKGIASGWGVTATVSVQAGDDVPKTGDASLPLGAVLAAGVAGAAAVLGAIAALIRRRLRG